MSTGVPFANEYAPVNEISGWPSGGSAQFVFRGGVTDDDDAASLEWYVNG